MKKTILLFLFFLFPCLSFGAESYTTSCSYWSSIRQGQTCTDWRTNSSSKTSCSYWSSVRQGQTCTDWRTTQRHDGSYETSCSYWSSVRQGQTCTDWRTR